MLRATGKVAAAHKLSHDARDFLPKVPRRGPPPSKEGPLILSDSRSHCNASLVRKRRKARKSLAFIWREKELCAVLSAAEAIHLYLTISIFFKHIWPLIIHEAWGASQESNLFSSMRNTNTIVDFNAAISPASPVSLLASRQKFWNRQSRIC